MTLREIYRQQLSLRGIRLDDQMKSEEWADARSPWAATVMDRDCPPHLVSAMEKAFGAIADDVYAPMRRNQ